MSGAPGSGKSTIANLLAPYIDAVVFNHDTARSTVLEFGIPFDQAAKLAYSLGWTFTKDMIKQGRSVILDSPCNYEETLDRGSTIAREHGYEYWYVECRVEDIDVLDERLRKRPALRCQRRRVDQLPADASSKHYNEDPQTLFKRRYQNPLRPQSNVIIVDSTNNPEKIRDDILEHIRSAQRSQVIEPVESEEQWDSYVEQLVNFTI